ncbi:hypothetical protein JTY60_02795 [symbiont of Argiope bruennichi]|uniref:hypothetical protein n=1 Tax=symbiont of Argiope bruennichi TaxID=2810479 RepID=UPI003DA3D8EC
MLYADSNKVIIYSVGIVICIFLGVLFFYLYRRRANFERIVPKDSKLRKNENFIKRNLVQFYILLSVVFFLSAVTLFTQVLS